MLQRLLGNLSPQATAALAQTPAASTAVSAEVMQLRSENVALQAKVVASEAALLVAQKEIAALLAERTQLQTETAQRRPSPAPPLSPSLPPSPAAAVTAASPPPIQSSSVDQNSVLPNISVVSDEGNSADIINMTTSFIQESTPSPIPATIEDSILMNRTATTVEVTEFVQVEPRGEGLGFSITGGIDAPVRDGETGVFVSDIFVGGSAAMDGRLQIGDRILHLNGVPTDGMRHDQAVLQLQSHPHSACTLLVSRVPSAGQEVIHITVVRGADGLGFSVVGGLDAPEDGNPSIFISDVDENGAANEAGLMLHDQLLEVAGQTLAGSTHGEMISMLRSAAESVVLTVLRVVLEPSTTMYETLEEIVFAKVNGEHGFSIGGGVDRPVEHGDTSVYVTHIVEGGGADADGRLQVEDRIVEVNGEKIGSMSYDEAVLAVRRGGDTIQLVIARLPATVDEQVLVTFDVNAAEGLGFTFRGGVGDLADSEDTDIYVVTVNASGSAAGHLQAEDKILEVNGQSFENMAHTEAASILGAVGKSNSTMEMVVVRLAEPALEKEIVVSLLFEPCPAGVDLGFSIGGGTDEPLEPDDSAVYVIKVADGGPAYSAGLRFGDRLITVGNSALTDVQQEEAATALGMLRGDGARGPITVQVGRLPLEDEEGEGIVEITFERQPGSYLGLSIVGGSDTPVREGDPAFYVMEIVEDGAAALDGRLRTQDKLLVCNGHSLANETHEKGVAVLTSNPKQVSLIISRLENSDSSVA
jgi:C-terminal processing protease CtpA/Prc